MNKYDREIVLLRALIDERQDHPPGIRREDLTTDMERDAFDIWAHLKLEDDLGIADPADGPMPTYEEVLAYLIEVDED